MNTTGNVNILAPSSFAVRAPREDDEEREEKTVHLLYNSISSSTKINKCLQLHNKITQEIISKENSYDIQSRGPYVQIKSSILVLTLKF